MQLEVVAAKACFQASFHTSHHLFPHTVNEKMEKLLSVSCSSHHIEKPFRRNDVEETGKAG